MQNLIQKFRQNYNFWEIRLKNWKLWEVSTIIEVNTFLTCQCLQKGVQDFYFVKILSYLQN